MQQFIPEWTNSPNILNPGRFGFLRSTGFDAYFVAQQYLYAGDYDRTIDWLEKSYELTFL